MKRFLLTLAVLCVSIGTAVTAQSQQNESLTYKGGYALGYYLAMTWPYIVLAIAAYVIYRFVKRKKASAKA